MWHVVAAAWVVVALGCGRLRFESGVDASDVLDTQPEIDAISPRAPVLHLDFEGSEPLRDKVRGHVTRCVGTCPEIIAGAPRGGFAATFANAVGCIHVADDLDLRSPNFTYATWFRPLSTPSQTALARPYESETGPRNTFELAVESDPDPAKVGVSTYVYGMRHKRPLTIGAWHHAAGSYDGQTLRVYYDGVLVFGSAVPALPLPLTPNEPLIGCDRDTGVDYAFYRGEVDDVRIYAVALTDAEVAALAAP